MDFVKLLFTLQLWGIFVTLLYSRTYLQGGPVSRINRHFLQETSTKKNKFLGSPKLVLIWDKNIEIYLLLSFG